MHHEDEGGGNVLTAAGLMWLDVLLGSSCGLSFNGDLLSLLLAGDLLLPKISLHLGISLTCAPPVGEWPSQASFSSLFLPTVDCRVLIPSFVPFCLQVLHSASTLIAYLTVSPLFLLALVFKICCIMTQSILLRWSSKICIKNVLFFFDTRILPIWARRWQMHPRLDGSCIVAFQG